MILLPGHVSADTAFQVDDYPYGFRLRCKIRYWIEYNEKHGFRFVSQTSNPKRGNIWNKPKASTYARFGGALVMLDNGHVDWVALSEYSSGREAQTFLDAYGSAVPAAGQDTMRRWVAAKVAYDANRTSGDPLHVGLAEARKAFLDVK